MGKGGYNGGSTVIHGGSGWFAKSDGKPFAKRPITAAELVESAEASARRATVARARIEATIADVGRAKRDAIRRLKRQKRKAKASKGA